MKTLLSMLLIGFTLAVSGQNKEKNNVVQQQVHMDNNIRNYIKNPTLKINTRNINLPYATGTQKFQTRGNSSNSDSQNIELPQVDLSVNLNLNVPSINLNINHVRQEKINPEKVKPKRVKDFRIKTRNTSSGSISHKPQKVGNSLKKNVLRPIRCWAKRTFKHTAKFQLSCECFKF
jgi:hypothetical protein